MGHKFGDAVTLVQKSRDGTLTRVNATVLRAAVQPTGAEKWDPKQVEFAKALKGHTGKPLPGGEYLDLAFPNLGLAPAGQLLTTSDPALIFKLAHAVPEWNDAAFIGWEESD